MATFLISQGSLVILAWTLSGLLVGSSNFLDRLTASVALFPSLVILVTIGADSLGSLNYIWSCAAVAAAGACALALTRRRTAIAPPANGNAPLGTLDRLAIAWLVVLVAVSTMHIFYWGTGYFSDDFGYHAVAVDRWIQEGRLVLSSPAFTAYYPLNAELFAAWFCLPFKSDALAGLSGWFWLLSSGLLMFQVSSWFGNRLASSLLIASIPFASSHIAWVSQTFSATDLAGTVSSLMALYAMGRGLSGERTLGWAAICGASLGFAIGYKFTTLPLAAILIVFTAWTLGRRAVKPLSVVLGICALVGGYWYVRNAVLTGNPFFPAQLGPFDGPFHREMQLKTSLVYHYLHSETSLRFWARVALSLADWPAPLAMLSFAGYMFTARAAITRGDTSVQSTAVRLLWLTGVLLLLWFPFSPYSQGSGVQDGLMLVYARYILTPVAIGWVLLSYSLTRVRGNGRTALVFLTIAALAASRPIQGRTAILCAGLALGVYPIAHILVRWAGDRRAWITATAGVILLAVLFHDRQLYANDRTVFATGDRSRPVGEGWAQLEKLPGDATVTAFDNEGYWASPYLGRRLQHRFVSTDSAGMRILPVHLSYSKPAVPFRAVPAAELLSNLRHSRVTHVFVTKWPIQKWPAQYTQLSELRENVRLTWADGYSSLFEITQ